MTLAAILGIVVSLAPVPDGVSMPVMVLLQEESKPPAEPPSPSQPSQQEPPAQAQPVPSDAPPPPPETTAPATETPAPATVQPPPVKPRTAKAKSKPASSKTRKPRKRPAKPAADPNEPKKVVVSNGSTAEPVIQISSGKSDSQDVSSTNSLLDATESNLKKLSGKQLLPVQQDMVKQIRAYLDQAKTAAKMGDTQGAHNLAFKAHLLSEELLKK